MNKNTLRRAVVGTFVSWRLLMSVCLCRSDEITVSFDQLWPQGRVAQVLQLSKQLIRCSQEIKAGNLTPEERVAKMADLVRLTKEFGERMCHLDYEELKEDEYLYIYTIAKQALALHTMLQD